MNEVFVVSAGKKVQDVAGSIAVDTTGLATEAKQDAIITAINGIPGGGGTQYTEGDTDASITGTALLWEDTSDTLRSVSATKPLPVDIKNTSVEVTGTFWQATQPVSVASIPSHPVTNAGTFAVQVTSAPTTTVTATQLDVDNLNATDDVVTVTGGAGQTADVKVTLDGESVPVTGTFWQATQPVSIASAVPVTDNSGSLTVDAPVGTPVFVRLSDGASAIATLPVSLSSVPSHPVTNAGVFAVQSTNQANSGVDIGDVTINNTAGAGAVNIQDGGNVITVDGTVGVSGTVTTKETRSATPSQSSPLVTNSNTSILASNANRLGATIYNEGASTCFMKLGATASTTSYSCQIASGGYYEVPFEYTGAIDGITSSGTAQLRVTEIT